MEGDFVVGVWGIGSVCGLIVHTICVLMENSEFSRNVPDGGKGVAPSREPRAVGVGGRGRGWGWRSERELQETCGRR